MLQRELASRVIREPTFDQVETIAGVDASFRDGLAHAAICLFRYPELECLETVTVVRPIDFPYVPGLLGFREVPALLEAFERLERLPDLILVDGHGLAHPRRFGIASHLGVVLDRPTIGCAKSLLVGEHRLPARRRGSRTRLLHRGEVVGTCLRTRDGVKPVYASIGHRVDLATAVRVILRCATRYRLPEPIRAADRAAGLREG